MRHEISAVVASGIDSVLEDDIIRSARDVSIAPADGHGPAVMVAAVERAMAGSREPFA